MANIVVLGAGLVGSVMAKDLAKQHDVTSVDISQKNLDQLGGINTICADISDTKTLQKIISDFDLVVGAVPGFMGYKMMKDVIEATLLSADSSIYDINSEYLNCDGSDGEYCLGAGMVDAYKAIGLDFSPSIKFVSYKILIF